jgi:hypothetical protein
MRCGNEAPVEILDRHIFTVHVLKNSHYVGVSARVSVQR